MHRTPAAVLILLLFAGLLPQPAVRAADPAAAHPRAADTVVTARTLPAMPAELGQPSVHAEMLAAHAADSIDFDPGGAPTVVLDRQSEPEVAATLAEVDGGPTSQ